MRALRQVRRGLASQLMVMVNVQGCVAQINVYDDGAPTKGKCASPR